MNSPSESPEGAALRDAALEAGLEHADPLWKMCVILFIEGMPVGTEFSTDEIHARLATQGVTTHDSRALGGIIRALAKRGLIRRTGAYVSTTRPEAHCRPVAVWVRA